MKIKTILLFVLGLFILLGAYLAYKINARLNPGPTIKESPSTIIGFNHVGITVLDLDKMLDFYQNATNFKLLKRTSIQENEAADLLFGQVGISYEKAILKGPNMLLELTQFANQTDSILQKMLPQGPGMTHTCYQSSSNNSGYDQFKAAGVDFLSRGDQAIDLGGYGVTYAYAYDPEGNMVELEQMSNTLIRLKIGSNWAEQHPIWMTQVALMSADLPKLTDYYQKVLAIPPYRVGTYKENPGFDAIIDADNAAFDAAWFGMDTQGKKLELMQYVNPATLKTESNRKLTDLGYNFSFEVLDIQQEYKRLSELGINFISPPQQIEDFWMVFARDIDGNIFSLRQVIDPNSEYSLQNF